MRAKKVILAVLAIGGSLSCKAQGAADLAGELMNLPDYLTDATFEVLLPSALDPITYNVTLQSQPNEKVDSLAPCRYLIRWETEANGNPVEGFSAYYDGNHYRYRNNRLQEYHAEASLLPFMPKGTGSQRMGVQQTAQFVDMLPQMIGSKIMDMVADSSYIYKLHPDTVVNGRRAVVIDGVKRGAGYDQMLYTYVFDYDTHLPVSTDIETSPGSISEQIVTITYGSGSDKQAVELSEAGLIDAWPEVFELYRESTFRAENLVNTPLPTFASQILDSSERYAHHQNEAFPSPVIIAVLDPSVTTTPDVISAIREAVDMAPMQIDVLWAFGTNRSDEISAAVGTLRPGETALVSANSLIRNCGVTVTPTIILADRSSKVQDVIPGYNNETGLVVLQKATLLK